MPDKNLEILIKKSMGWKWRFHPKLVKDVYNSLERCLEHQKAYMNNPLGLHESNIKTPEQFLKGLIKNRYIDFYPFNGEKNVYVLEQ